jgi:hypothetical protein
LNVPVSFLILFLFALQGAFIWMVIVILKDKNPSKKTFDQHFYEDHDV